MAFYILHAGTSLQKASPAGTLTNITLPSGVTVTDARPARFAVLSNTIVAVNATSVNIAIDPSDLSTRVLNITGPSTAPTIVGGSSGQLNGEYRVGFTYAIKDGDTILTESPMSTLSDPITVANKQIDVTGVTTSGTSGVNARLIYMTTAGGAVLFKVEEIANNTGTTVTIDTSDFDIALLPFAEDKGNPPGVDSTDRLRLITSWKDRLFASPNINPDYVYVSGNREVYSWAESRRFTVKTEGEDATGVTAFMARRDELVIAKRRKLWKLIGDSPDNFEQILIADGFGAVNQDASIVVKDTCFFLGEDGFYEYGPNGVQRLSRDKVQPWFTTDDYFNRSMFTSAFAKYNQLYDKIELHLAAAGSSNVDRWVEFDLKQREWFGPHKTDAFTPTCGGAMDDSNGFSTPVIGSSAGYIYRQNQSTCADDGTAIDMDVITKFHNANAPDIEHQWGELSVLSKVEDAGTLEIVPTIGGLDADPQDSIYHDLTTGRERLPRLGPGRLLQLRFKNSENNQSVTIFGYEIPFFELGRR